MDALRSQVKRAFRRLLLQRFLTSLTWCLAGPLLVATAVIAADRFWPLGIVPWTWLMGAAVVGVLSAAVWTAFRQRGALDAAIEIDRRFGFKERVSSTLAMSPEELESEAGRALLDDAARRVQRVHIRERFGIELNRWSLLPVGVFVLAFLVMTVVAPASRQQQASATTHDDEISKQIETSTQSLQRKLNERRKRAEEQGLKDAEELFKQLEQGTEELAKSKPNDRKQALVKLNDLAKDLAKRRDALGGTEKLTEQLNQLKNLAGPANKFTDALSRGDFRKAMQEIDKLAQEMREGKLDDATRQKLAEQLEAMRDKLQKLADAHEQMKQQLERQIQQMEQAGRNAEAEAMKQQLAQLQRQDSQMQLAQQMAQQLAQAAQSMKQGNMQQALAGMQQLQSQLSQLQKQLDEMQMLEDAMTEIAMAKAAMNCEACQGMGCAECMGTGDEFGNGLGQGRGEGDRPEERTDTKTYDSSVKQRQDEGAATIAGFVEGPNARGDVQQQIQAQFDNADVEAADPLTDLKVPGKSRDHARSYFKSLREGQ